MKTFILILLFLLSFQMNAQTYHSRYNVVKVTSFMQLGNNDTTSISSRDIISIVDTNNLGNNNGLAVIIGEIDAYSNDLYCYLELSIRKSNVSSYFPTDTKIRCLIDYENHIIYDQSSKSIMPFNFPLKDSLLKGNLIDSIYYYNDSTSNIKFRWENERIEIESKKTIPSTIRGTLLDNKNKWGVTKLKTNNQLIELLEYELKEFNFKLKKEEIIKICTKTKVNKTLILL